MLAPSSLRLARSGQQGENERQRTWATHRTKRTTSGGDLLFPEISRKAPGSGCSKGGYPVDSAIGFLMPVGERAVG